MENSTVFQVVTRPELLHLMHNEHERAGEAGSYLAKGYIVSAMTTLLNGDVLLALQPPSR